MVRQQTPPYEKPDGTPEFYVDGIHLETQLYGITLNLGDLRPDAPMRLKAIIKMSPQLAKVLSLLLASHVRQYEENIGAITIPKTILHDMGLEDAI
jgi:hypothetical protein